jgi:hypothetical protein
MKQKIIENLGGKRPKKPDTWRAYWTRNIRMELGETGCKNAN